MSSPATNVSLATTLPNGGASIGPLPFTLTTLIGRETQVAAIAERLASPAIRLLTLIGPGGIGKSRLALEAAHVACPAYTDGAQLIRLASVTDPALVPVILARVLGVWSAPNHEDAWSIARGRHCLLLVDNFEQVLPAAPAVVDVLSHCPHVTMLVTSRVPLHVSGEYEFPVPPLATPPDAAGLSVAAIQRFDAVRLFVDRSIAVNPDFRLDDGNARVVAQITRQLDGLPLAIELAAAQSKHLQPAAIVERLAAMGDLLRGGPVDRPPHQRAIRETIAWSYELLDPAEQAAFRRMSIFAGGFTPQAAAAVCQAEEDDSGFAFTINLPGQHPCDTVPILDTCISLSDKNLIGKAADLHGEPRFSMLYTIKSFARAELRHSQEWELVGRRHAHWYLAFAERAARELEGPEQKLWLTWLDLEHPNLRDALGWFRDREEITAFARLANALSTFWLIHGHFAEGQRWLQSVIEATVTTPIAPHLLSDLLAAIGWLALRQGSPQIARSWAESSLEQARTNQSQIEIAESLNLLAHIEHRATNYARAEALFRESLRCYEQAGHTIGKADTLTSLATVAMDSENFDMAAQLFRDAAAAAEATGDAIASARAIDNLGVLLYARGNAAESLAYAERALDLYRGHGSLRGTCVALDHVGKCARSLGDVERAWQCHRESLEMRREVGDARGIAVWLEAVASLLVSCGRYKGAARVLGAVDGIRERGRFPLYGNEMVEQRWAVRRTSDNLAPDVFARHWARGAGMTLEQAVEGAYAEAEASIAALRDVCRPPLPDIPAIYGLTRREIDVLRYLARRLTDKEIAEHLSISPRTVSTHVTVILAKLGVHSRRDAAKLADEAALK